MYRSEVTVPIQRDNRTFEQRRSDHLDNLEDKIKKDDPCTSTTSSTTTTTTTGSKMNTATKDNRNLWLAEDSGISDWIKESRLKFNDDIQRMRKDFFSLEDGRDDFFNRSNRLMDMDSMMKDFEKDSQTFTSRTSSSTKSFNNSIGGGNSIFSDDPFANGKFGNGMGALTSMKDDPFFARDNGNNRPALMDRQNSINAFDKSKDAYELGADGQMHFIVRFDATDFLPEDIKVTTTNNNLSVSAKSEKKTANSSSVKEFSRSVDLPQRIDHEKFQCHLTQDGVLVLDAPVKAPEYQPLAYGKGGLGIQPISESSFKQNLANNNESCKEIVLTGQTGPMVLDNADGSKKIHIELPVDSTLYQPQDIHVRAEGNKIYIEGRHEEKSAGCSSMKEFSKYYEVPETLDPFSVRAFLASGNLVIEAPLKK